MHNPGKYPILLISCFDFQTLFDKKNSFEREGADYSAER
jgi:hypothetical protein